MPMKSVKVSRKCLICGDVALCVNYGVLSCCSCKSFFRRYSIHEMKYECYRRKDAESLAYYSNDKSQTTQFTLCPTNIQTRNLCKRCRMDKCLAAGMKKELILVRKLNDYNSASKKKDNNGKNSKGNDNTGINLHNKNVGSQRQQTFTITKSSTDDLILASYQHQQSPSTDAIDHYQQFDCHHIFTLESRSSSLELNTLELGRLLEVQQALSSAGFPNENSLCPVSIQDHMDVRWVLSLSALYIRKVVAFCKRMTAFRALHQFDQLQLLKAYIPLTLLARTAFLYQPQQNGWNWLADDSDRRVIFISSELFKRRRQRICQPPVTMPDQGALVRSLHNAMEDDSTIFNLIQGILLFCVDLGKNKKKLDNLEPVYYQQALYRHLLKRYLEAKYGEVSLATAKLQTICELLQQMDDFTEAMARLHLQIHNNHHHHHHLPQIPSDCQSQNQLNKVHSNNVENIKENQIKSCAFPEELIEVFDLEAKDK